MLDPIIWFIRPCGSRWVQRSARCENPTQESRRQDPTKTHGQGHTVESRTSGAAAVAPSAAAIKSDLCRLHRFVFNTLRGGCSEEQSHRRVTLLKLRLEVAQVYETHMHITMPRVLA